MKKLLGILVLGLMFFSPSHVKAGPIGSGEIKLKPQAVNSFIRYIQMKDKPFLFLIPIDGSSAYYWKCPAGIQCVAGGYKQELAYCERYFKKDCKVFAKRRIVKWANGISKGKKESKFNSKMTGAEIKAKLTSLGFLGGTTSATTKVEKKKKAEETKTTSTGLTEELKELNKLYKEGVLTKEEFEKAKKKLLN